MNLSPEQIAAAQRQMAGMSQEEMLRQLNSITPEQRRFQAQQMGVSPEMLENYANMMKSNPSMLNQVKQEMGSKTPEQLSAEAKSQQQRLQGSQNTAPQGSPSPSPTPTSGANKKAENLKLEGNTKFKAKQYKEAINKYEEALVEIYLNNTKDLTLEISCHLNIVSCLMNLEDYSRCTVESSRVLKMPGQQRHRKALFRRGKAFHCLERHEEAKADLINCYKLDKTDTIVKDVLVDVLNVLNENIEDVIKADEVVNTNSNKSNDTANDISPTTPTSGIPNLDQLPGGGMDYIENMNPEELKKQAEFFKNTPIETLRNYPQFANMSEEKIKEMISQTEMIANNPAMFEMAKGFMKNQMTSNQAGGEGEAPPMPGMPPGMPSGMPSGMPDMANMANMNPADLMKNMTPQQMSDMMKMNLKMAETNPEMFRSMGLDPDQAKEQMQAMADLPPEQLEKYLQAAQKMQPLAEFYQKLKAVFGANTNHVLIVLFGIILYFLYELICWYFY